MTWPPLIFGVIAGVCASGNFDWGQATSEDYAKLFLCALLSGPVLVGYTRLELVAQLLLKGKRHEKHEKI